MALTRVINSGIGVAASIAGEGTATTNLQQGLCKVWFNHGTDFASDDSLNVSSIADDGSGEIAIKMTGYSTVF